MRIWIVHQNAIPPIVMGPTRHFDLAKKLIEQGHEVFILAGNYCHNTFYYIAEPYRKTKKINYYSNVPFIWFDVPSYKSNSIQRVWNMLVFAYRVMMNKELHYLPKPDIIIGSSPSPFAAYAAYQLSKRFQVPFIYEIRDLWPETLISLGNFSKRHPLVHLMQKIENKLLKESKKIISVLPGMKEYLQSKNISAEKFLWLPNAVDLNQIKYQPRISTEKINVMYAGSFNIANDLKTLVSAAKILQERDQGIIIKLIGDGPLKDQLQNTVNFLKINNIQFLPTVKKEQMYALLAEADIFVGMVKSSPLYRFGTSLNKMTDYLAVARPIVYALDSPYSPVTEAEAGMTVPPENPELLADAILKIASLSPEERKQLGLNGRKYAEKFYDMEKIALNLIEETARHF